VQNLDFAVVLKLFYYVWNIFVVLFYLSDEFLLRRLNDFSNAGVKNLVITDFF